MLLRFRSSLNKYNLNLKRVYKRYPPMLSIFHLYYTFSNSDTGEVIRQYHETKSVAQVDGTDVSQFIDQSRLVSMIASFKRGCSQQSDISLTIQFKEETIF